MINKNGDRALAHIQKIVDIQPIEGADRIEVATVLGWKVVVAKADNFNIGDKVVYIEIDSKVPETNPVFDFLKDRHYRVKTIRLKGQYSQGLIMPISKFKELENKNLEVNDDVTDLLGITYYIAEDNKRKAKAPDKYARFNRIAARHPKLAKTKLWKWLKKNEWTHKFVFFFLDRGKKLDDNYFPKKFQYIKKTDEERIENCPYMLENNDPWVKTTKVDGTSATYILERKGRNKFEFTVYSRNVRMKTDTQPNAHSNTENVYWDIAYKYEIEDFLKNFMKLREKLGDILDYVCIQGEIAGPGIQTNRHNLSEVRFFAFNFIDSSLGRWGSVQGKELWENSSDTLNREWVPIIDSNYYLPKDLEEFKQTADGPCEVKGSSGLREGYVYRSLDGKMSFKNVSRKYLLKEKEDA